jgi:hypothetical protein
MANDEAKLILQRRLGALNDHVDALQDRNRELTLDLEENATLLTEAQGEVQEIQDAIDAL